MDVKFKGGKSEGGKKSCAMPFGIREFKVSAEVFDKVMKVRSDNLVAFKEKATEKFSAIIKEGRVNTEWDTELFKIALEAAKAAVDNQRDALKKIVSETKMIDDNGVKRKIKREEKAELHKRIMQTSNTRLRDVSRNLWVSLVKGDLASTSGTSTEVGTAGTAAVVGTSETSAGGSTSGMSAEVSIAGTVAVASTSGASAVGSPSVRLPLNLVEEDMLEFNSIMEEFSTSFEPVVCEVIDSMMEEMDIHSHSFDFDYILSKIAPVVSKRRYRFFTEGGFSARALSLLSRSRVMTADGSRITTDAERAEILNLSMTIIAKGIDNFVGSYVSALLSSVAPVSRSESISEPSQLVEGVEEEGKGKSKAKGEKRRREEESSDGVPAKFGSMRVHSEFNEDLDGMISEHIGSLREDVRSIRVDLESGYPHLTVEVRRDAMQEQSRVASDRLLSEFMGRV
ncbi:hypothetical protein, partial [Candidatus Ichthyocystis hellenicum]|uniref:hypothetical protein n=1 Tax=Candidatus Ichthyocystis hellenicum TaxID=1561003 RepID=UPI001111E27F